MGLKYNKNKGLVRFRRGDCIGKDGGLHFHNQSLRVSHHQFLALSLRFTGVMLFPTGAILYPERPVRV
jgi:hypothetical protein